MTTENGLVWFDFEPRPGQRVALHGAYNSLRHMMAWQTIGASGEALERSRSATERLAALREMTEALAILVADWDLADKEGRPLPSPADNPEAFGDLTTGIEGEISWLIGLIRRNL